VYGFSAGGHLAVSLGTLWNDPEILKAAGVNAGENQPDALLLCYPVISARHHAASQEILERQSSNGRTYGLRNEGVEERSDERSTEWC
jgi:acetyl esterase/lipase